MDDWAGVSHCRWYLGFSTPCRCIRIANQYQQEFTPTIENNRSIHLTSKGALVPSSVSWEISQNHKYLQPNPLFFPVSA